MDNGLPDFSNTDYWTKKVHINDVWEEDPKKVKEEMKTHFERRFAASQGDRLQLDGVQFDTISRADNDLLTCRFGEDEINDARVLEDLWSKEIWPKGSNASFIALIPKVDSPVGLNDFRPISLIGCIYKDVSKLLSLRLKRVLPKDIHDSQFAFLGGRNMLDSAIVVNKVLEAAKKAKIPTIAFKVDYEKAYDSVSWEFLEYMMVRLNFCWKWIGWIMNYLRSASVSVLINGSPCEEFRMQRGLRQGILLLRSSF
ncbi:uncharacterized protein LOC130724896 [Lotus japonicus]|uniref:uncharacterized protein LOC130724896 n=1 Tax=Lotus japonicus TaxID=34305 RepID=UPI002584D703|nr:uncharacterized protein LOC130724896 [Lotus japonicus]